LEIPRYGVLVAVSLIEPGTCCPLKRLIGWVRAEPPRTRGKPAANWEEKQKAAVESSRNCGEDELVLGMHGTGDRMFDLPHGSCLVK
jgi:hypothetical protein